MSIYTTGYSNHTPDELKAIAERLNALVIDIRYSPASRMEAWNRGRMETWLGSRYAHLPALGNKNYKGYTTQIADMEGGLAAVQALAEDWNVILLCVCSGKSAATCHRQEVAEALRGLGHEVRELEWSDCAQLRLF